MPDHKFTAADLKVCERAHLPTIWERPWIKWPLRALAVLAVLFICLLLAVDEYEATDESAALPECVPPADMDVCLAAIDKALEERRAQSLQPDNTGK